MLLAQRQEQDGRTLGARQLADVVSGCDLTARDIDYTG